MMTAFRYFCVNSECDNFVVDKIIEKESISHGMLQTPVEEEELCDTCGQPMKVVGYIQTGGYLKTSAMSKEEKQVMFKKRAHEHFEKKIKDKKIEMIRKSGV
jgi:hypothetical protein